MPRSRNSLLLLERYHDEIISLRDRTARLVDRRFGAVQPGRLSPTLQAFTTDAAQIIAIAQENAAHLAMGFLRAYERSEITRGEIEQPEIEGGYTRDGRPLGAAMGAIPAKVYLALKQGQSVSKALAYGRYAARRFVETEVIDAADNVLHEQIIAHPQITGWRWKSRGTCGGCLAMDSGRTLPPGTPLNRHPNCRCISEPVFNVRERHYRDTGHERFRAMSKTAQDAALGKTIAEAIRAGEVRWPDLVAEERPHRWHRMVVAASAQDVTE